MSTQLQKVKSKIYSEEAFCQLAERWKNEGNQIVFTNGCFDLLHLGHVDYLSKAKDLGEKLMIGLNSDASVKLLNKGSSRPIQDQDCRAIILSALSFVDAICVFNEQTPLELISKVIPDVLVKGADYKLDEVVGKETVEEFGGEVILIPLIENYSTSIIEKKIKTFID